MLMGFRGWGRAGKPRPGDRSRGGGPGARRGRAARGSENGHFQHWHKRGKALIRLGMVVNGVVRAAARCRVLSRLRQVPCLGRSRCCAAGDPSRPVLRSAYTRAIMPGAGKRRCMPLGNLRRPPSLRSLPCLSGCCKGGSRAGAVLDGVVTWAILGGLRPDAEASPFFVADPADPCSERRVPVELFRFRSWEAAPVVAEELGNEENLSPGDGFAQACPE